MKILVNFSIFIGLALASMSALAEIESSAFGASSHSAGHWRPSWVFQPEDVVSEADGSRHGAAWLKRTRHGIKGRIMTNVDTAGDPYSVWFVIFNKSKYCATSPCSADDLPPNGGDPRINVAVYNATGAISASDGKGGGVINADFTAVAGKTPDGICCFGKLARRNGLKAEVHIVVDKHPMAPDVVDPFFWVTHLTTPSGDLHRAAIFLPVH